ncbi:MAG: hypothetical protein O7H39_11295 [Gammaproteobacteria bacterium]|nr:hypothetical protein [Gammaproteobacteria bacterium]
MKFVAVLFCLTIVACNGKGSGGSYGPGLSTPVVSNLVAQNPTPAAPFAFVAASPYAASLGPCTYAGDATESCPLSRLPFLGIDVANPTVDDVMARVLISHSWMGANFRALLESLPADALPMFRSITAVVIAADVRPAYYDPVTGAIYLDPDFVWLTPSQLADISTDPDPRAGFGIELQVELPWRYVKDNQPLSFPLNEDGTRDLDQLAVLMGFLLYHELAHALDFMHPSRLAGLDLAQTPAEAASDSSLFMSAGLVNTYPLTSAVLQSLAGVSFLGSTSTPVQQALQPSDLVSEFALDGAAQYYSYTSQYEDFANLFDTVMMSFHFGYEKDTGITDSPASGDPYAGIVAWGQRGRFVDQAVLLRTLEVVQAIYPGDLAALEAYINARPPPESMRVGETWGSNLLLGPPEPAGLPGVSASSGAQIGATAGRLLEQVRIR